MPEGLLTPFSGKKSQLFLWVTCPSITCFKKVISLSTASYLCDCLYMTLQMFCSCSLDVKLDSHRKHRQHPIRKKIPKQTNSNQNPLAEL